MKGRCDILFVFIILSVQFQISYAAIITKLTLIQWIFMQILIFKEVESR